MRRRVGAVLMLLLGILGLVLAAGCAGTMSEETTNDPELIYKELTEIDVDMRNTEELIKGSKAQLQIDDSLELRSEIRTLEMNLIHLDSRKRALEERLAELAAR